VIDAAASIGAELPPLRSLPSGWAVAFSLHATKVLPAGEGGIVAFGHPDRAQAFRSWSNFGFDGRRESMRVGTNAKMTEMTAAFAHASLDGWEREREEWQTAHARARDAERELGLETVPGLEPQLSPYWIVLLPDAAQADAVETTLTERNIGTRRWWFPTCHTMAGFRHVGGPDLPNTDALAPRVIGLPMFRDLTDTDFSRVVHALGEALEVVT
jgi:dTDP-4-amino-4,6-dideoxygalactose transaminase